MFCCDICGKVYEKKCVFLRHKREVHKIRCFERDSSTMIREFQCSLCSRKYVNSATLKRHLRLDHAAAGKFICHDCGLEFLSRLGVLRHITKNHQPTSEGKRQPEKKRVLTFKIQSLSDVAEWLENFKAEQHIFLRKVSLKRIKNTNAKVVFRAKYRCGYSVESKKDSTRQTHCPYRIFIRVKREESPLPAAPMDSFSVNSSDLFTEVKITNEVHNHEIDCAAYARLRRVSQDVKEKFIAYFGRGFTPLKALKVHNDELRSEYGTKDYETIQGDRYYCPDISWVRRLYYKVYKTEYASGCGRRLSQSLSEKVSSFNEEHYDSDRAQMRGTEDIGQFAALQAEEELVEETIVCSSPSYEVLVHHSPEDFNSSLSPARNHDDSDDSAARNEERQEENKMMESVQEFFKRLLDRTSNNKPLLLASQAMIENYNELLRTDSALESAMRTFGKYSALTKKDSREMSVSEHVIAQRMRPSSTRKLRMQVKPK